jgi:hypothetical protein
MGHNVRDFGLESTFGSGNVQAKSLALFDLPIDADDRRTPSRIATGIGQDVPDFLRGCCDADFNAPDQRENPTRLSNGRLVHVIFVV